MFEFVQQGSFPSLAKSLHTNWKNTHASRTHTPQYCYCFLNSSLVYQRENNQVVLKQALLQIIIFK